MLRINYIIFFLLIAVITCGQENKSKWGITFSGFVNAQIFYDSRQMVEAREAMVSLFPKKEEYDNKGNDINSKASLNQLAMTSRLRGDITGPSVFGAKATAAIEGDFTGQSNSDNNGFRLREAWAKLNWKSTELLLGSYWHPLYVPEVRPFTIGLNTGAPYHAFSRHNQIRLKQSIKKLDMIFFAGMQRDYASDGPLGKTSKYQRDAAIPNMDIQLQYHINDHILGAGVDYKILQPRLYVEFDTGFAYKTNEKISSFAATAFGEFKFKPLKIKFQSIWGQNLTEHIMLGGYAEKKLDTANHNITYTNSEQISFWIDIITTGNIFKAGLFAGYAQNLGFASKAQETFYGNGYDIKYTYRISPRLQFYFYEVMFAAEFEYTAAAYGKPDSKDIMGSTTEVGNMRVLFGVFYFF